MSENNKKRQLVGIALENKMDKTAVIEIERRFPHPVYNKYIVRTKNIMHMIRAIYVQKVI